LIYKGPAAAATIFLCPLFSVSCQLILIYIHKNILFYYFLLPYNIYAQTKKVTVIIISLVIIGIGTALSLLLLVLTQNDNTNNNSNSNLQPIIQQTRPIKIAFSPWVGDAPLVLAADKFFKQNNVLVQLILTENFPKAEELYLNGSVDGLSSVYTNTIFHNSEGINSRLVWVYDYSDTADAIVALKNITTVADLKGKKIGIEGINSFSNIFVLQALANAGLYEKDVQFEDIPAQDVLKALNNRQIAAGHTWGPTKLAAVQKGYRILATAKDVPGIIADVLIFNSKIVEKRPDDIQAIVRSIIEGKEYLDNNKEQSLQILSNFFNMSRQEVLEGFEGIRLLGLKDNVEAMNKSAGGGGSSSSNLTLYHSGDIIAKYLLDRGQIRQIPHFDEIIDPKFVNTAAFSTTTTASKKSLRN
jgi:NitT/TauT family transport system substrate-binding protein